MLRPESPAPLPQGPQGEQPRRPGEPGDRACQPEQLRRMRQGAEPVRPGAEGSRCAGGNDRAGADPGQPLPALACRSGERQRRGDRGEQHCDRGRAARRGHDKRQCRRRSALNGLFRHRRHAVEEQGERDQLDQFRRGFVTELEQAERRDQREQRAIGDRPRVVGRIGFAAEGEGQRLRRFGARQVIGGVPGQRQRQGEQQRVRDAGSERRVEPGARQLDEDGADPVRQERAVGGDSAHRRREPRGPALGDVDDVAERGDVGVLPGVAPEQARQDIGRAQDEERQPRQGRRFALADECGIGRVHTAFDSATANDAAWAAAPLQGASQARKRQPKLPFAESLRATSSR